MIRKALILGKGASGKAAAGLLSAEGCEVTFADGFDIVVASPGIHVESELQFGVERLAASGVKLLAVTGSKGKSSVVKLVAEGLGRAGRKAVACGNYGLPVSGVDPADVQWAVVEVSSFQMETTNLPRGVFECAAVLNLQDDHLDRHKTRDVYHALKKRLLDSAKQVAAADPADAHLAKGSYFDNPVLMPNALRAVSLMRTAGLDDAEIAEAFASFVPLKHRMEDLGVFGGVRCIDDSKATSIAAMAAGVSMAGGRIRLVAGGLPKGDDPISAREVLTNRVKKVYIIGLSPEKFFSAWSGAVDCEVCTTLERAVERAFGDAEEGDTLLLSPGAASFDQFNSYGERGEVFARLVSKEGQRKK